MLRSSGISTCVWVFVFRENKYLMSFYYIQTKDIRLATNWNVPTRWVFAAASFAVGSYVLYASPQFHSRITAYYRYRYRIPRIRGRAGRGWWLNG
jgi:hypothetical protein